MLLKTIRRKSANSILSLWTCKAYHLGALKALALIMTQWLLNSFLLWRTPKSLSFSRHLKINGEKILERVVINWKGAWLASNKKALQIVSFLKRISYSQRRSKALQRSCKTSNSRAVLAMAVLKDKQSRISNPFLSNLLARIISRSTKLISSCSSRSTDCLCVTFLAITFGFSSLLSLTEEGVFMSATAFRP